MSDIPTEDNLSTKSSSIDLTSPIATDIESSKRISFVSDNLENFDEEKSTIFDHGEPELEPLEVPEISECSEAPSDVERIREMDIQRDLMSDIPAMRPSNPTEMNINIQEPLEISKPESPLSMHKGNRFLPIVVIIVGKSLDPIIKIKILELADLEESSKQELSQGEITPSGSPLPTLESPGPKERSGETMTFSVT